MAAIGGGEGRHSSSRLRSIPTAGRPERHHRGGHDQGAGGGGDAAGDDDDDLPEDDVRHMATQIGELLCACAMLRRSCASLPVAGTLSRQCVALSRRLVRGVLSSCQPSNALPSLVVVSVVVGVVVVVAAASLRRVSMHLISSHSRPPACPDALAYARRNPQISCAHP